ncbi:MAG TPA: hypothetical protein VFS43_23755 [Polyangiaceae bacterium]|nr:hypothetical protein [Polyangiaceae bacterium]
MGTAWKPMPTEMASQGSAALASDPAPTSTLGKSLLAESARKIVPMRLRAVAQRTSGAASGGVKAS